MCWLSQNRLCCDWPQRQRVARGRTSMMPSSRWTSILPLTSRGPFRMGVTVVGPKGSSCGRHQPRVKQCAARASPHDLGNFCAGHVRQEPRAPIQVEDSRDPAQALADMDAGVQVKADLDIPPSIDLSQPSQRYEWQATRLSARTINRPTVGLLKFGDAADSKCDPSYGPPRSLPGRRAAARADQGL